MAVSEVRAAPGAGRRLLQWATVLLVALTLPAFFAMEAAGWSTMFASTLILAVTAIVLVGLERAIPRGGLGERPPRTLWVDIGYTSLNGLLNTLLPAFLLVPFASAHALRVGGATLWPHDLPRWLDVLLCTLMADFVSYWWHRWEHDPRVPWFWRLHSVHHAPRYFDFWVGGHVHPLDVVVFIVITAGFAALLGVSPLTIEATMLFASVIGAAHHLDAETNLGALNRVIPFADHHTVHHSRAPEENCNFGNITTLWDQLFGTYRPPRPFAPQQTGAWSLVDDYPHDDVVAQLLSPFGRFWSRVKRPDLNVVAAERVAPARPDARRLDGASTSRAGDPVAASSPHRAP